MLGQGLRTISVGTFTLELWEPTTRYLIAVGLFSIVFLATMLIARAPFGRILIAIRENEERMRMLGYDVHRGKLMAMVLSGLFCAAAGASYALLFGYVGSTFASIQYSILPLLWVLLGGAATTLGPLFGTTFMFYVVDVTSGYTSAWLLMVGVVLILLVLFFPKGVFGTIRERWLKWLP